MANGIGDTRLLGMPEDQLYYHESVQTITQSCNHRPLGNSPQFKFHALELREVAVALSKGPFIFYAEGKGGGGGLAKSISKYNK